MTEDVKVGYLHGHENFINCLVVCFFFFLSIGGHISPGQSKYVDFINDIKKDFLDSLNRQIGRRTDVETDRKRHRKVDTVDSKTHWRARLHVTEVEI